MLQDFWKNLPDFGYHKNQRHKVLCMITALGLELYLPLRSWIIVLNFLTAHALVMFGFAVFKICIMTIYIRKWPCWVWEHMSMGTSLRRTHEYENLDVGENPRILSQICENHQYNVFLGVLAGRLHSHSASELLALLSKLTRSVVGCACC